MKTAINRVRRYYQKHGIWSLVQESTKHVRRELTQLPPQYYAYSSIWRATHGFGTSVMEYDWDNLIVLDACRLDAFTTQYDGEVNTRVTLGSNTTEFLRRTFSEGDFYDTVYLTPNPKAVKLEKKYREELVFHDLRWIRDCDPESSAVLPETVADAARGAAQEYPDKRLIIHINKPHTPWLGPLARKLREVHGELGFEQVRTLIESGEMTPETLREMYSETLAATLPVVEDLVADLNGYTAITADHGEMLYERLLPEERYWTSHPKRLRCSTLCQVPWVLTKNGCRPTISSDPPVERSYTSQNIDTEIEDRLTALGYKNE